MKNSQRKYGVGVGEGAPDADIDINKIKKIDIESEVDA